MRRVQLFEKFILEAAGDNKLTTRQSKKIAAWKDSDDRIWYGDTYRWLWKNASKIMKAKSVDDILKLKVGNFKPELLISRAWIRELGPGPKSYEDLVKMLKGVDTSDMGDSGLGKEFDVIIGEYPGRSSRQLCGTAFVKLAYDGKKDKLSIVNFGVKSGFTCEINIKTPRTNKDELPGFRMMDGNKLKSKADVERQNRSEWYWGISTEQSWEEIEAKLIGFFTDPDSNNFK